MDEIRYYEEDLLDLVNELEMGVGEVETKTRMAAAEKVEKLHALSGRLQRAKQVMKSFRVEMRDLPRDKVASCEVKAREYQEKLNTFHNRITALKQESERQQVGVRTVDEMSTQEVLQEADRVQDQSLSAIERMKRDIADSRQVGIATAAKLEEQTAQLRSIDADIMKVKTNLARADLLIRAFVRKMATDKIIMLFMCLIFIGVVVIIVYKFVDPQGADDAGISIPDEVMDPLGR